MTADWMERLSGLERLAREAAIPTYFGCGSFLNLHTPFPATSRVCRSGSTHARQEIRLRSGRSRDRTFLSFRWDRMAQYHLLHSLKLPSHFLQLHAALEAPDAPVSLALPSPCE